MTALIDLIEPPLSGEWGDEDPTGEGTPVLRTTNFTNEGMLRFDSVVTRQISPHKLIKKYLSHGDILIEKSGGSPTQPVGRVVFFENETNKFTFNNFVSMLRVKDPKVVFPKYLFYTLFAGYQLGSTLRYQNKTTGILNLQLDRLVRESKIPLPPLEEQKKIAATLDAVSDLIRLRKRQLEELDLLVKARFVEMFGDDKWNKKCLDELSTEWFKGQPFKKDEISDGGSNRCIHYGELFTKYGPVIKDVLSKTDVGTKRPSKKGDILFPASDVTPNGLARCSALMQEGVLLGGDIIVMRPSIEHNSVYLSYAINYQKMQLLSRVTGALIKHIAAKALKEVIVPVPSLELQRKYAILAEQSDKSKFVIRKIISELETLKQALIQEHFDPQHASTT